MKRQEEIRSRGRLEFTKRTQELMCFQQESVAYAGESSRFKASTLLWDYGAGICTLEALFE